MHASVLRYLREVARRGSVRKAALALNVASSAVNRQILKIEDELGVRLFDRLPDGMRLTPSGEVLLRHVRDTLHDYDRLLAEMDSIHGIRSGHIRIVALDSLLVDFLPGWLGTFADRYPAVTLSVIAAAPPAIAGQVASGEAELGVTFVSQQGPALRLAASIEMPLGVVMKRGHALAGRPVLRFGDLGGETILLQQEALAAAPFIDDVLGAFRSSIRPRFVSNSIEFLRHVLLAGLGIAFFTRLGFRRELESGELVWIKLAEPQLERLRLGIFIPTQRTLSPAADMLVSELGRGLAELQASA